VVIDRFGNLSGLGKEGGRHGFEEFWRVKGIGIAG
jgi:hypothetical protein